MPSISIRPTKGYIFTVLNPAKYVAAKRALITDEILFHIVERFFQHEEMRSSEWAERYHISESTVLRYLRKSTTCSSRLPLAARL